MKTRQKLSLLGLVIALPVISLYVFSLEERPRIVGKLADSDLRAVQAMVWRAVRDAELPAFEWDTVKFPGYTFRSLRRYAQLHILWIQAQDPKAISVIVGINTNSVMSEGWDFMMQKDLSSGTWEITGSAYWGDSALMPADLHIP